MTLLFAFLTLFVGFFFIRNVLHFLFSLENYRIHKKRLKQLRFQQRREKEWEDFIDQVTQPIIRHVLSRWKPKGLDELDMDLRMAKWDRYFSPKQYVAMRWLLKALGLVMFLLLSSQSMLFALLWGGALFFGMDFLFRNSVKNRKERLLQEFPDFIRITEGYVMANFPIPQAVQHAIPYVGEEWKPILQKFVVDCEIKGVDDALEGLKHEVDLFEVREFVALMRLVLEQGGDVKQGFSEQAEKIRQLINDLMAIKVGRRQMMAMALQAPLLICILVVVGLPTISSMLNMNTM